MFWAIFFSIISAAFVIKYVFPWLEIKANRKKILKIIGIITCVIISIILIIFISNFFIKNLSNIGNFLLKILYAGIGFFVLYALYGIISGFYEILVIDSKKNRIKKKKKQK